MNWIVASLLMFLCSVALYFFVRKSNTYKTPLEYNNLAMFLIPVLLYGIGAVEQQVRFSLNLLEWTIIIVQGVFFAYLGNVFSLKGIEHAPNPGYSLIISKSYVVFTSLAAVFLFGAILPWKSVLAIMCIVGFSALLVLGKSKRNMQASRSWFPYTMGAFFCWGLLSLSTKYLLLLGVPILTRLVYSMAIVVVLIVWHMWRTRIFQAKLNKNQWSVLGLIGLFATGFNYFQQVGLDLAPNVGFVNATNAASISLLTILTAYYFHDELTPKKMLGVAGVTVGLILLFL